MHQARQLRQKDVVCKTAAREADGMEVLRSPRLARKLSCCLQDRPRQRRPAKLLQRNVLDPELRCCLQECAAFACDPGASVAGGCVPKWRGDSPGNVSSNRDCERATCVDCPGTPRDIRDRKRSCSGDNRCGAFAGTRLRHRLPGGAGTSMAGRPAGSSGNAVHPYGRCLINSRPPRDIETAVESPTASPPMV